MNQAQVDLARYRMQRAYETQQDAKFLLEFEKRTDGDYEDYHVFTKNEVEDLAAKCDFFLKEIKKVLDKILEHNPGDN